MPDFLTLPQVLQFEAAMSEIEDLRDNLPEGGKIKRSRLDQAYLPAILGIVQDWRIAGIENPTLERMPLTPRLASAMLIAWLWNEISALYVGEIEIPND